jgi:hypothetical protein
MEAIEYRMCGVVRRFWRMEDGSLCPESLWGEVSVRPPWMDATGRLRRELVPAAERWGAEIVEVVERELLSGDIVRYVPDAKTGLVRTILEVFRNQFRRAPTEEARINTADSVSGNRK